MLPNQAGILWRLGALFRIQADKFKTTDCRLQPPGEELNLCAGMEAYTSLYVGSSSSGRPPRASGNRPPPLDSLSLQLTARLSALEVSQRGALLPPAGAASAARGRFKRGGRPPRPSGCHPDIPDVGEALEGSMSRGVSWWDLPEEERLARARPSLASRAWAPRQHLFNTRQPRQRRRASRPGTFRSMRRPGAQPDRPCASQARVWPGESEDDAPESPSLPSTPTGSECSNTLRPWTLSYIPPEHLRLNGCAPASASPVVSSMMRVTRLACPRGC